LVWGGVHPAGHSKRSKYKYFSKNAGDVPLWTIISWDLVDRSGREYSCWKGYIVFYIGLLINFICLKNNFIIKFDKKTDLSFKGLSINDGNIFKKYFYGDIFPL
jgi:hypothetical protein